MSSSERAITDPQAPLKKAYLQCKQWFSAILPAPYSRPERCSRFMIRFEMRKEQLARQLARESRIATAAAADQVDRIVSELLMRVRKGQSASLPGLGTFRPGSRQEFPFEKASR
jgi:hypothetical protein